MLIPMKLTNIRVKPTKVKNFKVFEAEIIGTENMYLEDRLKIHQAVLSYLDAGATIEEAEIYVKTKFKHIFG